MYVGFLIYNILVNRFKCQGVLFVLCYYLPGIWKNKNTLSYCENPKGLICYKWNHFIISILPHWIKLDMRIDT